MTLAIVNESKDIFAAAHRRCEQARRGDLETLAQLVFKSTCETYRRVEWTIAVGGPTEIVTVNHCDIVNFFCSWGFSTHTGHVLTDIELEGEDAQLWIGLADAACS
jgi:hypothetical protein